MRRGNAIYFSFRIFSFESSLEKLSLFQRSWLTSVIRTVLKYSYHFELSYNIRLLKHFARFTFHKNVALHALLLP